MKNISTSLSLFIAVLFSPDTSGLFTQAKAQQQCASIIAYPDSICAGASTTLMFPPILACSTSFTLTVTPPGVVIPPGTYSLSVSPTLTTTYTLTETKSNGNSYISTKTVKVVICSGIETIIGSESFIISPNPSRGKFTIKNEGVTIDRCGLEIYNMLGEKVYSIPNSPVNLPIALGATEIDISSQPSGVYFLKFLNQNGIAAISKIIKE